MTDDYITWKDFAAMGLEDDPDVQNAVAGVQRDSSWMPADLGPAIRDELPEIRPTLLPRADGKSLLYPGKTHSLAGEPESGKSWVALLACVDAMRAGHTVAYLDFEDSVGTAVERLRALKLDDETIASRFLFVSPEDGVRPRELDWVLEVRPALVIVDGANASIVLQGFDPQDTAGTEKWRRQVLAPLRNSGAAVLVLDHVVKSKESRSRYAFGSQHKLGALDGAAYLIEPVTPFSRTRPGLSRVKLAKDRPGWVRAYADMDRVADFRVVPSDDGTVEATLDPPLDVVKSDDGLYPADRRVLAVLPTEQTDAISQREIGDAVAKDGSDRGLKEGTIDDSLRRLKRLDLVDGTDGVRGQVGLWWRNE